MRKVLTAIPLLLGLVGLIAAAAPGASAAVAAPAQRPTVIKVVEPMRVVGFSAAIARAHGYTVHTNARGQRYVTKIGAAAVSPRNVLPGPCGESWVDYSAIGERSQAPRYVATLSTGYTLNAATYGVAVEGYWVIAVADPAGTGDVVNTHPVSSNGVVWSQTWNTYHSKTGYSLATVLTRSYVITDEGWYCASAGPHASTTLKA